MKKEESNNDGCDTGMCATCGEYVAVADGLEFNVGDSCYICTINNLESQLTQLKDRLARAEEVVKFYAGNFNGKDGSKWNGDIFFIETNVGSTESACGDKYAKEYLKSIGDEG